MLEMQPITPTLFGAFMLALSSPLLALESGEDRFESFGLLGETDNYSIEVAAGAFIQASMGVIDGDLEPSIIIFDPDENIIAEGNNTVRPGFSLTTRATEAGTYRIKTTSVNRNFGDYRITVVAAPGPLAASDDNAVLTSGQTVEGSIPIGDLDVFTIEATAGAAIRVGLGRTDDEYRPRVTLIDPSGEVVENSLTSSGGTQIRASATLTGTYTIIVSESSGFRSGDYRLSAFVSGQPLITNDENSILASGQRVSGDLPFADFDAFEFSADAGDVVRLAAGNQLTSFQAEIEIFGPDGLLIENTQSSTTSNTDFTAPSTGIYTALISDDFGTTAADYQVTLVTLPTDEIVANDGINRFLPSGTTIEQTMNRNDLHFYSFAGTEGDAVTIDFERGPDIGSSFSFRSELFSADGSRLLNSLPGQLQLTLPSTGDYYLVILQPNNRNSGGDYLLTVTGQTGTSSVNFVSSSTLSDVDLTALLLSNGTIEISYPTSVTGLSLYRSENSLNNFLPLTTLVENGRHVFRVTNPTGKEFFRLQIPTQ